jgi:hypothetical protein
MAGLWQFPCIPGSAKFFPGSGKKFPVPQSRELLWKQLIQNRNLMQFGGVQWPIHEFPGYFPDSREFAR